VKHIEVVKINPRFAVTLSKEQFTDILLQYLRHDGVIPSGELVLSYPTADEGYYLVIEEEKTDDDT